MHSHKEDDSYLLLSGEKKPTGFSLNPLAILRKISSSDKVSPKKTDLDGADTRNAVVTESTVASRWNGSLSGQSPNSPTSPRFLSSSSGTNPVLSREKNPSADPGKQNRGP